MTREKVKFDANIPQTVTLQYPVGKIVNSSFGDAGQQVMWGLAGDRVMFLPLGVAERINALKPQAGDSITVVKLVNQNQTRWNVWFTQPTEVARAHRDQPGNELPPPDADESPVAQQIRGSIENIREGRPAAAPRPQPVPARPAASALTPAAGSAANATSSTHNAPNRNTALISEANDLVDAYAAVLDRSLRLYEGRIKPDEIKALLLSCYISRSKNGGANHAAA